LPLQPCKHTRDKSVGAAANNAQYRAHQIEHTAHQPRPIRRGRNLRLRLRKRARPIANEPGCMACAYPARGRRMTVAKRQAEGSSSFFEKKNQKTFAN
jgi:hypothetical protein